MVITLGPLARRALLVMVIAAVVAPLCRAQDRSDQAAIPLSAEDLAKLRRVAMTSTKIVPLPQDVCRLLLLCPNGEGVDFKSLGATVGSGKRIINFPLRSGSDDIVLMSNDGNVHVYLTNSSRGLRMALLNAGTGLHVK